MVQFTIDMSRWGSPSCWFGRACARSAWIQSSRHLTSSEIALSAGLPAWSRYRRGIGGCDE